MSFAVSFGGRVGNSSPLPRPAAESRRRAHGSTPGGSPGLTAASSCCSSWPQFERLTGRESLIFKACSVASMKPPRPSAPVSCSRHSGSTTAPTDWSSTSPKCAEIGHRPLALLHARRWCSSTSPSESVDPVSAAHITEVLQAFCRSGGTVVFSSHVMDTVEKLCDRLAVIHYGNVIAGTTERGAQRSIAARRVRRELVGGGKQVGSLSLAAVRRTAGEEPEVSGLIGLFVRLKWRLLRNGLRNTPASRIVGLVLRGRVFGTGFIVAIYGAANSAGVPPRRTPPSPPDWPAACWCSSGGSFTDHRRRRRDGRPEPAAAAAVVRLDNCAAVRSWPGWWASLWWRSWLPGRSRSPSPIAPWSSGCAVGAGAQPAGTLVGSRAIATGLGTMRRTRRGRELSILVMVCVALVDGLPGDHQLHESWGEPDDEPGVGRRPELVAPGHGRASGVAGGSESARSPAVVAADDRAARVGQLVLVTGTQPTSYIRISRERAVAQRPQR